MRCEAVSIYYGQKRAIDGVSMGVAPRTATAFIGPSGCGKSTLLRAFNRMHDEVEGARVEGEILLDGRDIYAPQVDAVELRRRVGMVFQRPNPLPKSVFDNVAFGLRLAGERDGQKIAETVERCLRAAALWDEVRDRLHRSALGLSGGQQQRLCIARALAIDPELLLMDEPASALDPIATAAIEELIIELKREFTIILVTHSMSQARRVADTTAFFYLGQLIEHRATDALFAAPSEARTREYLGGKFG
nr:phosphate ABC transporter ATP-binding protein PstB [Pseudenhygromyxa sp. WMMC2535]